MLDELVQDIADNLDSLRNAGGALEGVNAVFVGDENMESVPTESDPAIIVRITDFAFLYPDGAAGFRLEASLLVTLFLTSMESPGEAHKAILALISRAGGTKGLIAALQTPMRGYQTGDGVSFMLRPNGRSKLTRSRGGGGYTEKVEIPLLVETQI